MKIFKIIGVIDAILIILVGILNFFNVRFPNLVLPIFLSILVISSIFMKKNQDNKSNNGNSTENRPLCNSNKMTSAALGAIGEVGGPRCCKRDSYLAITKAVEFVNENFGIEMELDEIKCIHSSQNNQCIGVRCPFK